MSNRRDGTPLWEIRGPDYRDLFVGTLEQMVAEINRLHRETGQQHAARQV